MAELRESAAGWIETVTAGHDFPERLGLEFDGCIIEVRSNNRELVDRLTSYYADFAGDGSEPHIRVTALEHSALDLDLDLIENPPGPGKTRIKEEYADFSDGRVVRKRLTGMVFLFDDQRHVAIGPCVENDNQVINFINNRYIQWRLNGGALLCHAAGVSLDERGLAMAGWSGRGKSTLALHLLSTGLSFVSNDRVLISNGGELTMYGVPKLPRVNPGTLLNNPHLIGLIDEDDRRALAEVPDDELWNLEQKYDVFLDKAFGPGRFRTSAAMTGLVMLNWERGGGDLRIRRIDFSERGDLLQAFMKSVGVFYRPAPGSPVPDFSSSAYIEALRNCPVFELSGGVDFDAATETCAAFLRTGVMPGERDD
jgi:HprK-related kinase B